MTRVVMLREARPDDLQAIERVFWRCWTISYAGLLEAEVIARLDRPASEALWRRALEYLEPGREPTPDLEVFVLVAEVDGRVWGVVKGSAPRAPGGVGQIHSLYVDPEAQGLGLGRALLDGAVTRLIAAGTRGARLWVFADNEPGLAFYRHLGWRPDGKTRIEPEFGALEMRLSMGVVSDSG